MADSKLYNAESVASLKALGFITRIPNTLNLVKQVIHQALKWDQWRQFDATLRYQSVELGHYGMDQRWLVVYSDAAFERAEATVTKAQKREAEAIEKQLFHLQAQRFETPDKAHVALAALVKRWRYHQLETSTLIEHKHYASKGRPTAKTPIKSIDWQIHALM